MNSWYYINDKEAARMGIRHVRSTWYYIPHRREKDRA